MTQWVLKLLAVCLMLGGIGLIGWAGMDSALTATSGNSFCISCHSMRPIAFSYRQDVHGGNNAQGIATPCADCHLPHEGHFETLFAKVSLGIHDFAVETFTDTQKIDWLAKRNRREEFTHDSGCLRCHNYLEQAPLRSTKGVVAHKPYFLGQSEKTCTSCHPNVGHKSLEEMIQQAKKEGK